MGRSFKRPPSYIGHGLVTPGSKVFTVFRKLYAVAVRISTEIAVTYIGEEQVKAISHAVGPHGTTKTERLR